MAYSVVYDENQPAPFLQWQNMPEKTKVIFTYYECEYCGGEGYTSVSVFLPDLNGESGLLLFRYNDAYKFYVICARVLIDMEYKRLYFHSVIVYHHLKYHSDDQNYYFGGVKYLRKLDKKRNVDNGYLGGNIIRSLVNTFFGQDWRYCLEYKKRQQKWQYERARKFVMNQAKYFDKDNVLNYDIYNEIAKHTMKWTNIPKTSNADIVHILDMCNVYIGGEQHKLPWRRIIGVHDIKTLDTVSLAPEMIIEIIEYIFYDCYGCWINPETLVLIEKSIGKAKTSMKCR